MSFKIIEKYIQGKSADVSKCEDKIVITTDFVCVIDGATSKSHLTFQNKTQGVISAEIIERILKTLDKAIDVSGFVDIVNGEFRRFYTDNSLQEHMNNSPVDRLNASVIIYSDYRREIWLVGDCQAILNKNKITNAKLVDFIISDLRAFLIESLISKGITVDELLISDVSRRKIMPFLREQSQFQNNHLESSYSYGVFDGFPIDKTHIKTYEVPLNGEIILSTDGYPELYDSLEQTENYLQYILEKDPLCYKIFKSTKGLKKGNSSFDDRAYVRIEVR